MRYYFHKSFHIILINFIMSFLLVLGLSSLVKTYKMTAAYPNGMSENYIVFDVMFGNDENINLKSIITTMNELNIPYVLYRTTHTQIHGVYSNNQEVPINIVSGRNLSENDFIQGKNVAIISEEWSNRIQTVDNIQYFNFQNGLYEVVGIYRRSENNVNPDAYAIYNLISESNLHNDGYVEGLYSIDVGNYASEAVNKLKEIISFMFTRTIKDNSFSERIVLTAQYQGISMITIGLVIMMVLLNSADATLAWIDNRRKEIFVRFICGATHKTVINSIVSSYLTILIFSNLLGFIVALLCSKLLYKLDFFIFNNFDYSVETVLFSLLPSMIIGIIILAISLLYCGNKKIY